MKYNKLIVLIITLLFFESCVKDEPEPNVEDIIVSFESSNDQILADGTTTITITAVLNKDGDEQFRNVNFTCSRGQFQSNGEREITKAAEVDPEDRVVATVTLVAPTTPGEIEVTAEVDLKDLKGRFIRTIAINSATSEPETLTLTANAISVKNNFNGEINLTGTLRNTAGNKVSNGVNVSLTTLDQNNNPITGCPDNPDNCFRQASLTSGSASTISAVYTPGNIAAGQFIKVVGNVVDDTGPIGITDTLEVYIIE